MDFPAKKFQIIGILEQTGKVTCLMREHTMENEIWHEGQLGAVEGALGTVDQLIIHRCIMEEVNSTTEILLSHSTTTRRHTIKSIMTGC